MKAKGIELVVGEPVLKQRFSTRRFFPIWSNLSRLVMRLYLTVWWIKSVMLERKFILATCLAMTKRQTFG